LVGATGSGKTTVVNLLMRFYDVDSGEICIDGQSIAGVARPSLRKDVAIVLQDTVLFTDTVRANLTYANEHVTQEKLERAVTMSRCDSLIAGLPQGMDTVLTASGANISQGQRQLLTIARAMLSEAKMLILDEATSNVDTRTEIRIREAMLKLMEGKTCFVIAHRLSTIQNADNIIVVNNGKVEESGTHTELMKRQGFYYKLYASQFQ
ncbi:MAG: ABC transporter ATP-binding protein, partial [Lachnospiraceae bacterium]